MVEETGIGVLMNVVDQKQSHPKHLPTRAATGGRCPISLYIARAMMMAVVT